MRTSRTVRIEVRVPDATTAAIVVTLSILLVASLASAMLDHRLGRLVVPAALVLTSALVLLRRVPRGQGLDFAGLLERQSQAMPTTTTGSRRRPGTPGSPGPSWRPEAWLTKAEAGAGGLVDADRCRASLVRQLGRRWNGFNGLWPHERCVAIVATLALTDPVAAYELRGAIDVAYAKAGGDRPDEALIGLLEPHVGPLVKRLNETGDRHAYVSTALVGMVAAAKATVGLPSSEFLWLKEQDRKLWYALNNVGRQSFHVEGIAAIAHYAAERSAGTPLEEAQVAHAVHGILRFVRDWVERPTARTPRASLIDEFDHGG